MGFLENCPGCGTMIAKGSPCPQCKQSDTSPPLPEEAGLMTEYERRRGLHTRNYTIFMLLMFGTGLVGLYTAWLWIRIIYRGDVIAFVFLVLANIFLIGLGFSLKMAKTWFPTALNCPQCDVRLDELGLNGDCCPGCQARLR